MSGVREERVDSAMRPAGARRSPTLRDIAVAALGALVLAVFWIALTTFMPGPLAILLFFVSIPAYVIWLDRSGGKPKKGHCPNCGYHLTGLPATKNAPCPECGKSA